MCILNEISLVKTYIFFYMELRDKIPGMSFVKINIINILAKGINLIILSEGIIKLQHSEAVVKNSQ